MVDIAYSIYLIFGRQYSSRNKMEPHPQNILKITAQYDGTKTLDLFTKAVQQTK